MLNGGHSRWTYPADKHAPRNLVESNRGHFWRGPRQARVAPKPFDKQFHTKKNRGWSRNIERKAIDQA